MPKVDPDQFYRAALTRYGYNAEGVHWESSRTQQSRFSALRALLPAELTHLSLVDAGCGLGDLFTYLEARGERPRSYLGIDVVEPMVEIARSRTHQPIILADVLTDPLPAADYYVCSGAMNTLTWPETERFIRRCLGAARAGFVFNLLHGTDDCPTFNYRQPEDIQALAEQLNASCRIETGYLVGDFSAALHREQRGSALPLEEEPSDG